MALNCAALVLLGLAATAVAGPVNSRYSSVTQCAGFCPENTKFGFETGKTYEYDYESAVKTHIPGASADHSTLHMNAIVKLEVLSRCEMALRLESVELKDVAPGSSSATSAARSRAFATAMERLPLRFAFVSGNVEAVCPGAEEETWVLNIKRALLSHLQNTMNDFNTDFRSRETDVTGDCPVTYTTESAGWNGVHTIKKSKNVEACSGRLSADTVLQGTAYKTASNMQSLPVMKGSHECQQKINKQGLLIESTCHESHLFRPMSKDSKGATTDITTKMTFKRETSGVETANTCGQAMPITFDHTKTREELISIRTEAERVLRAMCAQTATGVSASAPALFGDLVRELKKLDTTTLVSLHRDLEKGGFCDHAEKYLHDAVPTLGTAASARLIKNLVLSGEVTGAESALWLNSLAFVQEPTAAMLAEVKSLVSTTPLNRHAALAVSSLVNNFCRHNPNCGSTTEVAAITSALENHLGTGCSKAARHHNDVIAALKALGNTGHGNAETLNACMRNSELAMEVRVTAINAFRRMDCSADKSELVRIFENVELDSELRINAYLALMVCPTSDILIRVRNMLEREEVNQVGSFVWTHLTNLMETSSPLKQEIRQIVEIESLRKEFDMDKRKFSRNIEKSYFSEMFNSGASVESNIIWSPESFVPRSASVNLTADLFGHSVNLVEIGGRVEGLNGILDDLFDSNTPANANKQSTSDINNVDRKFGGKKTEASPKGSGYVRIFGNEIAYADFHDLDASTVREKFNYLNWLIELAKEHTVDFSKSFQFLDTTVNVATIAGFPLRIRLEGNAVTDIKMKGKLDMRNLAIAPHSLIVDGQIAPSAALEVTAEMGVDAFHAQTGVRTVDTMHTSTIVEGSIQLRDGRIFAMDVKMARDKIEIFTAKHDIFVVYRGREHQMNTPASRYTLNKCLSGKFTTVTGLELCAEINVPDHLYAPEGPYFPLTTSGIVSFSLNKRDTFNNYHFEAKALREKVPHGEHMDTVDVALLSFNTPGSKVNRELRVDFSLNHSGKKVEMNVVTPWMPHAHFEGALTTSSELKRASAIASLGRTRYEALAEVAIVTNKYNTRFMPKFEVKLPSGTTPTVSGTILYRAGRKIDVQMVAQDIFSETINVEGSVTGNKDAKKTRYETTLNIKSPLVRGKIDGFVDRTEADGIVYSSRLEVAYKPANALNNRITFSGKLRDKNNNKKTDVSGTVAFTSNMWPRYDTDARFELLQQGKTLSSSFEGTLAGDKTKSLKIQQNGLLNWGTSMKKATMDLDVKLPYMNIDHVFNLAHLYKTDNVRTTISFDKNRADHCLVSIAMARESKSPLKANADIQVQYPGRTMRYQQSIEEVKTKEYRNELSLQLDTDQTISLTADYKMLPRHELTAQLTTPFIPPITFVGHLNPVLNNFAAKASFEHTGDQYAAEANMNLKINQKRANIQIIHPRRTITSDAEMRRAGKVISGAFETKWDANRDADKKFKLTGEVTLAKMRPQLSIKAELYPRRFIQIVTRGEFTHPNEICNHQGDFTFRSSFTNFEEISASFKNKMTSSAVTASGQMSWAANKKIDADFALNLRNGWKSVDANAKLLTPFPEVRRITYTLDYAVEGSTFRGNTKAVFNRHNIGLDVSGVADAPRLEGSVTMDSSFTQKIILTASHVDTGRKCHSEADLTWGSNKKISLIYNMDHARSGYHLNNNGDLQVKTPFKGFRNSKISWRHSNDESSVKHHVEVEMFKKQAVYDFDGSFITTGNNRRLNIKTFITAPHVDWRFTTEHQHNTENLRDVKTSALVQWETGKTIQVTNDFNLGSGRLQETFKFISPFEGAETITLDLDNTYSPNALTAKNELKWPGNKVSLNGGMRRTGSELDANLQLEAPFMETQKMTMVNKMEGNKFTTMKTYEYAPGKVIRLGTTSSRGTTKAFTLDFTSPFESMKVVNFAIEHTGTERDFTMKSSFFHNLMADKVEMTTIIGTSNLADMKVRFDLKTPIESVSSLQAMYSHRLEDDEFKCSGSFQIPSYKATFNHEMTGNLRRFNTKTAIMYKRGEKIELTTNLQTVGTIRGGVTFKSPFNEDIAFSFNREGPLTNMKSSFELSFERTKRITGEFEFRNTGILFTSGELTTPFMGYKTLGFTFKNEGPMTNFQNEWSLHGESRRMVGQTSFSLEDGKLNARSSLETPFQGYKNFLLTFKHEGILSDFNHEGLFEYPGGKFILKNNFVLRGNGVTLKHEIHTPFQAMRMFTIEAEHKGKLENFKNSLSFRLNRNKYEANSNFMYAHNAISGSAILLIPGEYSISFRHSGDSSNFNNDITVKFDGRQISGEGQYKYRGNNVEGSLRVATPFEGYKTFSFVGNHQGPLDNFQCDYTLEFEGRRMTISDEFKLEGNTLKAKLDISTPFSTLRNINFNFDHQGPLTNFKNSGFLKINNDRYTSSSELSLATNSISGSAVLTLPREYSITFRHNGPLTDFRNSFEIKADTKVMKGESTFKWDNGVELTASLTTPFTNPIVLKYRHNGVITDFEQEITLTHGSNNYFKKMKFEKKAQQITFEDEIRTPFEPIRTLIIEANHYGKSFKNFRNNIDIIHNGLKRSANVDFKWFSNIFKLKAAATIPEEYTLLIKNKVESDKLDADLKITTPSGNIDGSCQLEATNSAKTGSFVLTTPFTYFTSQSLTFEHKVAAGFESKLNIITSLPAFKTFEAILSHEGTIERFTTTGNVNLDSHRMSFTVSHHGNLLDFTSSASASMNENTISTQMSFKKETDGKITASGIMTTPITDFEKMTFNMNHEGSLTDFTSSASVAKNSRALNGQVTFKKTGNKITSTGFINTPFTNFEEMTFNFNHKGRLSNFESSASIAKNSEAITAQVAYKKTGAQIISSGSINTPFRGFERMHSNIEYNGNPTDFSTNAVVAMNDEAITADLTFKKADNLDSSITIRTPFTRFREMTLSMNHNGDMADFSSRATAELNNQAITGQVNYKKTGNKIVTSGTINTPFTGFEKITISLDHDGHLTDFETTVSAAINEDKITSSVMFKKIGKKVTTSLSLTTPFRNYKRMNIALEGHVKDVSSTASVTINGKTASFEITYKKTGDTISSVGSLNLPITDFERFAYTFNHQGTMNNFRTTLQVNTPFRNVDASYTHKGTMRDFECEGRIESDGQRYATDLKFKLGDSSLETIVSIETPHRRYENFGINMIHMRTSRGIKSSVNIQTPFEGYKALGAELKHDGEINDFRTTGSVNGASWPIKFSLTHKGDLSDFNTEGSVDLMNNHYTGSNTFKYTNGNVDATGSLRIPMGVYSYSLKHQFTSRGFTTEGSIDTPHTSYEKISFDLDHEGTLNNFATSGNINVFNDKGSFNVNHRGTIRDFTTSVNTMWNSRPITGEVAFKIEDGKMDTHATITTPFAGYERFHAEATHNKEGRKIKTEVRIETPFRQIRNPSFIVEHRGHWKNFNTMISLTTPFKHIKPMVMNINHQGLPRAFTSSGTFRYGRETSTANAKFERTTNGFKASADITTPFEEAKKFGINLDHSFDGRSLNTKGSIETPHQDYKNFGLEISHQGNLRKFGTSGKIESPFFKPVTFEMNHDGELTNFQSRGFIQHDGEKVEGEARYQKAGKSHDGYVKIATPFSYLRNADATLSHVHDNNYEFSGNLKGTYNTHKFDGDYSAVNKRTKSASLRLRHPQPMEYSYSVTPSDGRAEALMNWDATTTDKQIRFEATVKNVADDTTTDREVALTMRCPHDVHKMTVGYKKADGTFSAKAEFESSKGKFTQEVELTKNTRGREVIYDGSFKTVSPIVNFEINGNHKINAGRRYMTEMNIITSESLQFRSDIKTPTKSSWASTFIIKHPRFTKDVVIEVDGKIDTDNNDYEGKIDLEYAREKITFTGKIADDSNRYRTKVIVESSLKHPSNKVDVSFKSNFLNNKKVFKIDSEFTYLMSANNRKNVMTGTVDFNKLTEEMSVKVNNPVKRFDITGRRTISDASRQHFSISGSVDGETMNAEVEVDRTIPSISTSLDYAPDSTLHMYAKYISRDHFTMEAYRQVSGRKIPETAFDVEIVGGHLVKGRAFLRPGTVSDLSDLFSIDSGLGRFYSEISQTIANDLRLKVPGFKRAIEPVVNAMEMVSQGFGTIAQRTEAFFSSNQFYTRDIARAISGFFSRVRSNIDERIAETIEAISSMEQLYRDASAKYDEWRQVAVSYYNSWYQQAAAKMTEYRVNLHKKVAGHITTMQGSLLDLVEAIRNKTYVQSVLNSLQAKGERIIDRITQLADHIAEAAEQLLNRPEFSTIRSYVNKANEKTAWIFEYINMEVHAREWLHKLKDDGLTPLRRAAWSSIRKLLHLEETRINTWAPERGEIAGQVYIPMLMRDLNSMPTLNVRGFVDNIKRHIPDTDWVLWDTLYAYKPSSDIRDWIPPFKSHATIAGNQHYMTFDKKFFEFAGECSYLLARDFIDGTFSVVVNYENRNNKATKKSLTVIHGTDTVEILPEFRVEVNGRRSELPIIGQHTAVYRVGNTLRIDNDHGVKITCNLPNDHCTVAVTGWYFGKTAGLLGTYDNEHTTDFKKVTGERASTPEEFATSWTVGRQCRAINRAVQEEVSPIHRNYEQCATIFQAQTSAFRPCFKQRDPAPFMKMCINGDMCKVASFYVSECKMMEVPIRMPTQCVKCQLPNGAPMSEGQEQTVRGTEIPKKADVVFVISHGECNQDAVPKMNQVANQILTSMKSLGVQDVHFGLVGYGGEGRETSPHSHTMDGQLLNSKTTFLQTIGNFRTLASNNEDEDALAAMEFASRYAFREGASKSIVLMPCAKCNTKNVAYSAIQASLSDQDIKFHMLIHEDFKLSAYSKSPKTSYMYGIDRENVYTAKDARGSSVRGDRDLRRHTLAPKDLCVALSHETDGSVFNMLKLTETASDKQKRFATVLGRVVAKKGEPAECQRCECRSDESGVGVTVCHPCVQATPYIFTWDREHLPEPDVPFYKSRSL